MHYSENLIPVMTSNTAPSGIASASSEGSQPAWKAFDGSSVGWNAGSGIVANTWIQYMFPSPVRIEKYSFSTDSNNGIKRGVRDFKFQASNNGIDFVDLDSRSGITWSENSEIKTFEIKNNNYYKYYRLYILANNGDNYVVVDNFQMFEAIYYNKFLIELNDDRRLSLIIPDQNKDLIPKMTSASAPSGVVTTSSILHSNYAWNAFDDVTTGNGWMASSPMNEWICYQFPQRKRVGKYTLTVTYNVIAAPKDWTFEGSNDGQNWVVLDNRSNVTDWTTGTKKEFYIDKNKIGSYSYYRVNVSANNGSSYISLGEIEMMETAISLINVSELSEAYYIKYGMDKNAEIDLMTEINIEKFIQNQSEPLGLGKIFRKKIDTSKTPFKIEIL